MTFRRAGVAALAALSLFAITACDAARQISCVPSGESILMIGDLLVGAGTSALKEQTAKPTKTAVTYTVGGRDGQGDLYQSGPPSAAIVLAPGASTDGKDDARLVAFAETLARQHFSVLVPNIPNVRELKVKPSDARAIADAFVFLADRPDLSPGGKVGMGAFSYALGPTILAGLEPEVRERARFILGVGGYYNLVKTITYFTTGYYRERDSDPWTYLRPNWYGKWVFVLSNADRFDDATDRDTLTEIANTKVRDTSADVSELAARLRTDEGKALYEMLTNTDPERVPALLTRLPANVQADLATLDVSRRDLTPLKARLILFHGYDDNLVPYTETIALAGAKGSDARMFLINGFVHVDFAKTGFIDGWRMGCASVEILNQRR